MKYSHVFKNYEKTMKQNYVQLYNTHTHIHTHTYIQPYIYTSYIHVYMYACMYIYIMLGKLFKYNKQFFIFYTLCKQGI